MRSSFVWLKVVPNFDKNPRKYIPPTLNINKFIFIKDVLSLINKNSMSKYYHLILSTLHFAPKKQFKYLYLEKQFGTGYWILSDIISILEGGDYLIVKYFMDESGVIFVGGRTPPTLTIFFLE